MLVILNVLIFRVTWNSENAAEYMLRIPLGAGELKTLFQFPHSLGKKTIHTCASLLKIKPLICGKLVSCQYSVSLMCRPTHTTC